MGIRRLARERAIQFLYQHDLNPPEDLEQALEYFWETQRLAAIEEERGYARWGQPLELPPATTEEVSIRLFADPLIRGTLDHRDAIDAELIKYSQNWKLHRIAAVDRNILRLAIYEMRYRDDIPPIVSINEAVDLAKRFSTEESGRYINGVLDRLKQDVIRPARVAS